jgi:hypothetical protein
LVRQLKCCIILPSVAAPLLLLLLLLSLLLSPLLPLLPLPLLLLLSEAAEQSGLLHSGAWRAAAMVPEADNGSDQLLGAGPRGIPAAQGRRQEVGGACHQPAEIRLSLPVAPARWGERRRAIGACPTL